MLTVQSCKAAKARAQADGRTVIVRDDGANIGLELRCSRRGKATFSLVYRITGDRVPKRFRLGHFPGTTLASARQMLPDIRSQIVKGMDPAITARWRAADAKASEALRKEAARAAKIEEARKITVPQLMDEFIAAKSGNRSIRQYRQMLELNIRGPWARFKAIDVTGRDTDAILSAVAARGNSTQPRRVFEVIRAMLSYAQKRGIIPRSTWLQVTYAFPERQEARDRILSASEMRWLWGVTERWANGSNLQRAVRLILLLGQRSNEICGLLKRELSRDGKTLTIGHQRTKNKRIHVVPLPPMARQIITEAVAASPSPTHVFVGKRGKPLRADTLVHLLADEIRAHNDQHGPEDRIKPFVIYDLRRTLSSGLEVLGIPANVISATLNHISEKRANVTGKHYLKGDMSLAIRAALTEWQGTVEAILAGRDPLTALALDIDEMEARILAKARSCMAHLRLVS